MNAWKVILATVVIFLTGVVTGGLLVRHTDTPLSRPEHAAGPAHPGQPIPPGSVVRMDFLKRMQKELDLTPDQRQHIDKMLKEHQENIKKIMEPAQPEIHEEILLAKEEFVEQLTPAQRARFEESLKEQQRGKDRRPPSARLPLADAPPAAAGTNSLPATNP